MLLSMDHLSFILREPSVRRLLLVGVALAMLFLAPSMALCQTKIFDAAPIARRVIGLYDGLLEPSPAETRIHRWAELPLNYLGLIVSYHDVRHPLPEIASDSDVAGIISWFSQPIKDPFEYFSWARDAVRSGKKIAILGEVGGGSDKIAALAEMNALLAELGVRARGRSVTLTHDSAILANELDFEAKISPVLPAYPLLDIISSTVRPLVLLKPPFREGGGTSTVAAISPRGGFVSSNFEVLNEQSISQARWRIDPFRFLSMAFGVELAPHPDLTTTFGRRNFFVRMDIGGPDGVVDDIGGGASLLQIFKDEILPSLKQNPISITAPIGEASRRLGPKFKDMFGTSGFGSGLTPYLASASSTNTDSAFIKKARVEIDYAGIPAPVSHSADGLGPLIIWPRGESPSDNLLAALRGIGIISMQESSNRLDPFYPSITNLAPIARPVGQERLLYSLNAGEDMFSAQRRPSAAVLKALETTQRKTGGLRRLAGIDYHFHIQSLRSTSGVRVVREALAAAAQGPYFFTKVEHFSQLAASFVDVRMMRIGELSWRIDRRGAIQTFRVDDAEHLQVDMSASKGVLGQRRHGRALYIALDEADETVNLSLQPVALDRPLQFSLVESRWRMWHLDRSNCNWSFITSGYGPGELVFEGLPEGDFAVSGNRDGKLLWSSEATTKQNGRLVVQVPADGVRPVKVHIQCLKGRRGD